MCAMAQRLTYKTLSFPGAFHLYDVRTRYPMLGFAHGHYNQTHAVLFNSMDDHLKRLHEGMMESLDSSPPQISLAKIWTNYVGACNKY